MAQFYSDPTRETETYALPDAEVFHLAASDFLADDNARMAEIVADMPDGLTEAEIDQACKEHAESLAGWYYWYCFPGCMPDSDPFGPFKTEADAVADAREQAGE